MTPMPTTQGRETAAIGQGSVRAGDHVLHGPTGETWLVAWADPATDDLAWLGWPDGIARLSDCTRTKAASDEEHQQTLRSLKKLGGSRAAKALRLYGEPVADLSDPLPTGADAGEGWL
jgi:hypothetical protein